MAKVAVIMGSDSDLIIMQDCLDQLEDLGIDYEMRILSAHRTPEELSKYVLNLEERGFKVVIAGAGLAAHLAGVVASQTLLPVIGVPLGGLAGGLDALLSMAQMPGGVPVGTMEVGKSGAKNSAIFAGRILALSDPGLMERLKKFQARMRRELKLKERKVLKKVKK
jgi:phosphoribosylaminoimidazole carboxylase PurE protein